MRCQALSDPEETVRFGNNAGFGATLPRYLQKETGKTELMTAAQWLDRNAGWCESYQARISPDACKSRQNSGLNEFCKGCKGIRKGSGKSAGGMWLLP
jgi:hypothetical protein